MHHTVVGDEVGDDDIGIVDHDAHVDADLDITALEGGDDLAIAQVRAEGGCAHHVVEQHLGESAGRVGEQGVKSAFREGCNGGVGRSEHRERPLTGEVVGQASRNDGRFQDDVVRAVDDDVHDGGRRRSRRRQDGVDDVHDTVGSFEVGHDDRGHTVHHHDTLGVDGNRHIRSIDRGDGLAVAEVRAEHGASRHVVGQD